MKRAAVVLSGCGVFDGSEIHEAVAVLYHLSRAGARTGCFAPDKPQMHVVDHLAGAPAAGQSRNVLTESARIARGQIRPLSQLRASDFDAVVIPGGFGAAKNLCNFADAGAGCQADPAVARVLREFHAAGKPIGLCCIAPVLAAQVLGRGAGGPGVKVTIGNDPATAAAIAGMGSTHINQPAAGVCIDEEHNVVTTPAYMYDSPVHTVFEGIGKMVEQVLAQAGLAAAPR